MFMSVYVCECVFMSLCVRMCAHMFTCDYVCPQRPEALDSQEVGVTGGCDPPHTSVGN